MQSIYFVTSKRHTKHLKSATHSLDPLVALAASGGKELLVAVLTVEGALLLHEADIKEGLTARLGVAVEVVGAPVLTQRSHERSSEMTQDRVTYADEECSM